MFGACSSFPGSDTVILKCPSDPQLSSLHIIFFCFSKICCLCSQGDELELEPVDFSVVKLAGNLGSLYSLYSNGQPLKIR